MRGTEKADTISVLKKKNQTDRTILRESSGGRKTDQHRNPTDQVHVSSGRKCVFNWLSTLKYHIQIKSGFLNFP